MIKIKRQPVTTPAQETTLKPETILRFELAAVIDRERSTARFLRTQAAQYLRMAEEAERLADEAEKRFSA